MDHLPEVADLCDALAIARHDPSSERAEEVQHSVRAATEVLRSAGWPVEAIIVFMKQTARDLGYGIPKPLSMTEAAPPHELLLADVVRWCIQAFYDGDST